MILALSDSNDEPLMSLFILITYIFSHFSCSVFPELLILFQFSKDQILNLFTCPIAYLNLLNGYTLYFTICTL